MILWLVSINYGLLYKNDVLIKVLIWMHPGIFFLIMKTLALKIDSTHINCENNLEDFRNIDKWSFKSLFLNTLKYLLNHFAN